VKIFGVKTATGFSCTKPVVIFKVFWEIKRKSGRERIVVIQKSTKISNIYMIIFQN
jgi:hypothetical protein